VSAPLQALVANLDSSDYLGRLAIGRIFNGRVRSAIRSRSASSTGRSMRTTVTKLYTFEGLKRIDATSAAPATSSAWPASRDIMIGETIADAENPSRSRRSRSTSRRCR
jgi:GTP-binding protein